MATHTVTQPTQKTSTPNVKSESGFWRRWRKNPPAATAAQPEPDTFPHPDGDTQILPRAGRAETAPGRQPFPQVLYRERPADLDRAAYWIALEATNAGLHRWSAIKLEEALARHLAVVRRFAAQERAEGLKLVERHDKGGVAAGAALEGIRSVVDAEIKANELPGVQITAEIDTDAYGRDLGATWSNAHAVTEQTATFQPITPGMPDPRVKVTVNQVEAAQPPAANRPSPVHIPDDGSTPPVPTGAVPAAEALPQRTPQSATHDEHPAGGESA